MGFAVYIARCEHSEPLTSTDPSGTFTVTLVTHSLCVLETKKLLRDKLCGSSERIVRGNSGIPTLNETQSAVMYIDKMHWGLVWM